ncbi:casein kinase II subunit alpha, chloroplastic-like [Gossypium australe]|uniref:Casein kinase II subunit alpha, chloroplastic-like n=1 Tax=Gossypium australe TaxID=47621 RepID=A0A5B6WBB4_9ROSI|nr:casein kinase II subunit alpha, chloroplastic-like [Gossypium australe]
MNAPHTIKNWQICNGLDENLRPKLDEESKRAFMNKTYGQAYQFIEDMVMNLYMWPNERVTYNLRPQIVKAIHEEDKYQQILNKFNRLETTTTRPPINEATRNSGYYHENQPENMNYLRNRDGNPYSITYNSGWKDISI